MEIGEHTKVIREKIASVFFLVCRRRVKSKVNDVFFFGIDRTRLSRNKVVSVREMYNIL